MGNREGELRVEDTHRVTRGRTSPAMGQNTPPPAAGRRWLAGCWRRWRGCIVGEVRDELKRLAFRSSSRSAQQLGWAGLR